MKENIVEQKIDETVSIVGNQIVIPTTDTLLPARLQQKLLHRLAIDRVADFECKLRGALHQHPYTVRGYHGQNKVHWFGIVSEQFSPVYPEDVQKELRPFHDVQERAMGSSYWFQVPLESSLGQMHAYIDLGRYGAWGGSGEEAVKYGVSWFNGICSNWTIFLQRETTGKIFHRHNAQATLQERLTTLQEFGTHVEQKIEESKTISIEYDILEKYLECYQKHGLNKGTITGIKQRASQTVYDLAFDMTQLCQSTTRTPYAKKQVELLAGELIVCYPAIREAFCKEMPR